MSPLVIAIILAATFVTATISGVFGMAGGLIMKGVLVSYMPVAISMVMHGFIQIVSNLSRSVLWRKQISWRLVGRYAIGAGIGVAVLAVINWRPGQTQVFLLLGFTAMLAQVPKSVVELTVERPLQAEICGFSVQVLNTLAGVAGPLLDIFFIKTQLPRQRVVATKAATQVLAHAVKIAFWGGPLLMGGGEGSQGAQAFPPLWLFAAVIPLSLLGTSLGGKALDRMTDGSFRSWTKWIVTATGAVYLVQGAANVAMGRW
jgi:uncharacterized membrane protein YfcA